MVNGTFPGRRRAENFAGWELQAGVYCRGGSVEIFH
jgi:hypothetical protein